MPRRRDPDVYQAYLGGEPSKKDKYSNPINSELRSVEEMHFATLYDDSFPYRPLRDLFLCHLTEEFEQNYKTTILEKKVPPMKDVIKRYIRKRYLVFVRRELRAIGIRYEIVHRDEDRLCLEFPQLWDKWQKHKSMLFFEIAKRERFSNTVENVGRYLQVKWIEEKKLDFVQRSFGLREERVWLTYTRSKGLNKQSNWFLYCKHKKCWAIRISHFPFIIFMWIKFLIYWRYHPEVYQKS